MVRKFRDGSNLKFSGIVSCCRIGLRSSRTGRLVRKKYKVISNHQKITEAIHRRVSQCGCGNDHAAFKELKWHETETDTKVLATYVVRFTLTYRTQRQS